jgi:hypothetical protein
MSRVPFSKDHFWYVISAVVFPQQFLMSIKIISLNCRGLGSIEKRRDVLNFLKQKRFSIYFLQDTHFTESDYSHVSAFWGYNVYISHSKSDARRTAILINNNFEHRGIDTLQDKDGNYVTLKINICNKYDFLLINLYGPNRDCTGFFFNLYLTLLQTILVNMKLLLVILILYKIQIWTIIIITILIIRKQGTLSSTWKRHTILQIHGGQNTIPFEGTHGLKIIQLRRLDLIIFLYLTS